MLGHRRNAPLSDVRWGARLSAVRTHLDAFDAIETACLVYAGHAWTEQWAKGAFEPAILRAAEFADFSRILSGVALPEAL